MSSDPMPPGPAPPDPAPARRARRDLTLLGSPRAASMRGRVYRRQRKDGPRDRLLRVIAIVATLLLHLGFLIGVVLGPAYVPPAPVDRDAPALQVRLIDLAPEPPPPPPPPPMPRGTRPSQRGPTQRAAKAAIKPVAKASRTLAKAAPTVKPAAPAAPAPPVAGVPTPAPTPDLQPVPVTGAPPTVQLDTPSVAQPVPPKFQPEPMRRPTLEGNQPVVTPPSVAMPAVPAQAPPRIEAPSLAIDTRPPDSEPPSLTVAKPQIAAAPPVPALQAVPLPAQQAPAVTLDAPVARQTPAPPTQAIRAPSIQAPDIAAEDTPMDVVPVAPPAPTPIEAPAVSTADVSDLTPDVSLPQPVAITAEPLPSATPVDTPATPNADARASQSPAANPQAQPSATPGTPQGTPNAPPLIGADGSVRLPSSAPTLGQSKSRAQGQGKAGTNAGGKGQQSGEIGSFIQVKPQGNTEIMRHTKPDVGYRRTRFEDAWAPENETILDTAVRHAIEKTTVKHTFHLPRGTRIECVGTPLFPLLFFGCVNPDPPAKPLDEKIYTRLNEAPAALVPPAPTTAAPAPTSPILLNNSADCATAKVAGAPPPPGCASSTIRPLPAPASSGSWAPASDRFQ